jgi:hypothetical protein
MEVQMRMTATFSILFASLFISTAQAEEQGGKKVENIDMTKGGEGVYITPKESHQVTPSGTYTYPRGTEPHPPQQGSNSKR